ncbi:MAG: hypothetical protein A2Y97_10890 [Nitrospirae bacterium RBG_13_39_12]|nr:MAG: hypothetical protein A2Y97_10890 [Nitrospirae bacterium RBG_13_39_12]
MEDIVPEGHLLRLVDQHIDFGFIKNKVRHLYSHTGRPSIDPEILLRMLLIGYLYGITSERRLCEEVKMHIGYRWFVGLNMEDTIPDHSTFSKNRHERFAESGICQEIFDEIIRQCTEKGLLTGKQITVDSAYIRANASFRATTDLYHAATYVMDNKSRIIIGSDVGKPDLKTDSKKALEQIRRIKWKHKIIPESIGADKGYATGEFINNLINENIKPHIPIFEYQRHNHKGIYTRESFTYDEANDIYLCPEGKEMRYWGIHKRSRQYVYRARTKDCKVCMKKHECTKDRARSVGFHIYEDSISKAKELNKTKAYRRSQRMRKRIEELFGEAKEFMGMRTAKFRRLKFVKEQVLMTSTAQNIKRMVKLLSGKGPHREALAAKQPYASPFLNSLLEFLEWIFNYFEKLYSYKRNCSVKC